MATLLLFFLVQLLLFGHCYHTHTPRYNFCYISLRVHLTQFQIHFQNIVHIYTTTSSSSSPAWPVGYLIIIIVMSFMQSTRSWNEWKTKIPNKHTHTNTKRYFNKNEHSNVFVSSGLELLTQGQQECVCVALEVGRVHLNLFICVLLFLFSLLFYYYCVFFSALLLPTTAE